MGIKGLSKNVIKQVWRDGRLADLPAGTRIGVDAAGWLHKSVVSNATALCTDESSTAHHSVFVRLLQQLLHAKLEVVLVFDGDRWALKRATHTKRRNDRDAALARAREAASASDWKTADKEYKKAVTVPDGFVGWVMQHVSDVQCVRSVVANFEMFSSRS